MKETFKKKINVDFRNYRILGACNPTLAAHEALQLEDKVGTMLPCNVVVQDVGGGKTEVVNRRPILALTQIWCNSDRTDQASLKEIDLPSAIHLAFDELELGDLTFGQSVRPRQDDRGADGSFVLGNTTGERSHQA